MPTQQQLADFTREWFEDPYERSKVWGRTPMKERKRKGTKVIEFTESDFDRMFEALKIGG